MTLLKPYSANTSDLKIEAEFTRHGRELHLKFELYDPKQVLIDSLKPGQWTTEQLARADGLWKTTCCEAFWGEVGKDSYWELNLSASAPLWNLYHFESYRNPQPPQPSQDFELLQLTRTEHRLECRLRARADLKNLEVSLCAVAKTAEAPLYYANHHSGEKADFHRRAGFTLRA